MIGWKIIAALASVASMFMLAHPSFQSKKESSKWVNLGWHLFGWFYIYITLVWIAISFVQYENKLSIISLVIWTFTEKR